MCCTAVHASSCIKNSTSSAPSEQRVRVHRINSLFTCCSVRVAQTRPRHVRKRSEGSGFDTASRWTDISREEKGKWLIQEYGKVRFLVRLVLWAVPGACLVRTRVRFE